MVIRKIHIISFGKFENFIMEFHDGFNMIYGENGYGKTTIMAFIAMMFYGSPAGNRKSRDVGKNLRLRYTPWNGKRMDGALEFEHNGDNYRIEKIWGKSERSDIVHIYKNGTQEIKLNPGEDAGEHFLHMDARTFERSIFIGSECIFDDGQDMAGDSIAEKISNLVSSGDESVSSEIMYKKMLAVRDGLVSKSGRSGELVKIRSDLEEMTKRYNQAAEIEKQRTSGESEAEAISTEIEKIKADNLKIRKKEKELAGCGNRNKNNHKIRPLLLFSAIGIAAIAIWLVMEKTMVPGIFLLCAGFVCAVLSVRKDNTDLQYDDIEEYNQILSNNMERLAQLYDRQSSIVRQTVLMPDNPETIRRELQLLKDKERELDHQYEIAVIACEVMEETMEEMRESFGPELNMLTSDILAQLTGDIYKEVMVHKNYRVQVVSEGDGHYRDNNYMSGGTRQQIYLALRLALTHMLTENETMPLLLDDILAQYDDTRAKMALRYLEKYSRSGQVILFTCHGSHQTWCNDTERN